MKNILARGGIEFLAVFLGIVLSFNVEEWREESEIKNNLFILFSLFEPEAFHFTISHSSTLNERPIPKKTAKNSIPPLASIFFMLYSVNFFQIILEGNQ